MDFEINQEEMQHLTELQEEVNTYLIIKSCMNRPQHTFLNIQQYLSATRVTRTEKSNVYYLEVMDAVADTKDTMIEMLYNLHHKFIEDQGLNYLVVEGDAKLFNILQSLKHEYGDKLQWVIPYPGNWHTLKNYQPALLKAYFDAGLKDMARAAGYSVNQIYNCSHFKRVHHFILEPWEALYKVMLTKFLEQDESMHSVQETILDELDLGVFQSDSDFSTALSQKLEKINKLEGVQFHHFNEFLQRMAQQDSTWKFWVQFILKDALAYIGLFSLLEVETGT